MESYHFEEQGAQEYSQAYIEKIKSIKSLEIFRTRSLEPVAIQSGGEERIRRARDL